MRKMTNKIRDLKNERTCLAKPTTLAAAAAAADAWISSRHSCCCSSTPSGGHFIAAAGVAPRGSDPFDATALRRAVKRAPSTPGGGDGRRAAVGEAAGRGFEKTKPTDVSYGRRRASERTPAARCPYTRVSSTGSSSPRSGSTWAGRPSGRRATARSFWSGRGASGRSAPGSATRSEPRRTCRQVPPSRTPPPSDATQRTHARQMERRRLSLSRRTAPEERFRFDAVDGGSTLTLPRSSLPSTDSTCLSNRVDTRLRGARART